MSTHGAKRFRNRELSWLAFNGRVLDEAGDRRNSLLDRLKFIAIFSSNLDEFFMVRVAGLYQQIESGSRGVAPCGTTVPEQLRLVHRRVRDLVKRQERYLLEQILPGLEAHGIALCSVRDLGREERESLLQLFEADILPVLTPVAVDTSHPFPILTSGAIELLVELRNPQSGEIVRAFVEVPKGLPRFVQVAGNDGGGAIHVPLEEVIVDHAHRLFGSNIIQAVFPFRVTRDMDFSVDEDDASDLLSHLEKQLRRRRRRAPVRLEVAKDAPRALVTWLRDELEVDGPSVYRARAPLDLAAFMDFGAAAEVPGLAEQAWPALDVSPMPEGMSAFEAITNARTIPVFPPFERFDPVVRFLAEAAVDPDVLAIKQTLYRVSGDSPVVKALQQAAENGKQVTVIVEVKARFDEERNIAWARRLEESGAHVVYGIRGLKVHCKALLVVRREEGMIRRYVHLATGNYNDRTAKLYTDIGIFATDPHLCRDVGALFNLMTGYSNPPDWYKLAVAPFDLRRTFNALIDREARLSSGHRPGRIVAKMNALVDPGVIERLYAAAAAGVRIDLIVRGTCCLRPKFGCGNIRVVSIVDRYLEHSRVFYFENGGLPEYYLSSADWMPRNLDRRIEILFPVEDAATRELLMRMLALQLGDRAKGRRLLPDDRYTQCFGRSYATRSQRSTYELFVRRRTVQRHHQVQPILTPITG